MKYKAVSIQDIEFTYLMQPPKRFTFEMPEVKKWTESWCKGKVLNLFAGKTKLDISEFRVDMDERMPADTHMRAERFLETTDMKFDTVLLDPPYSLRKARETYGGRYIGSFTKIKDNVLRILNPGARVITYGFSSVGMSDIRGFRKVAICVICHGGDHQDTLCLVEDRINTQLSDY